MLIIQYHPIDRFRSTDSIIYEMFRQDHPVVARESSHLQSSADNDAQTWGAPTRCPAAFSQPYAVSEDPRCHIGNTLCGCPEISSVEQPERQRLHRYDSRVATDGLHQGCRSFSTSCPMLPRVHSATVGKRFTAQPPENLSAFSNPERQAASSRVPGPTGHLAASNSMARHNAVSTEVVLDTGTGTFTGFSSGPLLEMSALSATNAFSARVRSPLEVSPDPSRTRAVRCPDATTSPSEDPIFEDREASLKPDGVPTRIPHKLVERRYRDKVKAQLDVLYSRIPALKLSYPCILEVEGSPKTLKCPPKAVVIAGAVRYIEQLESELKESRLFVERLQEQVTGLQKLVKCDDCSLLRYFESAKTQSAARVSDS